jgi:TatD DNase family protein
LAVLDGYGPSWRGVVHCFTGGPGEAEDWLARGFHLSIPGVVTFPGRGALADAVPRIPRDRLLVETDSPYLTPVPFRGRRNEPSHVVRTAAALAALRGVPYEELVPDLVRNTRSVFGL